jgi:hypothetical protein
LEEEVSDEISRVLGLDRSEMDDDLDDIFVVLHGGQLEDGGGGGGAPPEAAAPFEEQSEDEGGKAPGEEDKEEEESPFVAEVVPDAFAAHLGLRPAAGWRYVRGGNDWGNIRALPSGSSLKATCKFHQGCSRILNTKSSYRHT